MYNRTYDENGFRSDIRATRAGKPYEYETDGSIGGKNAQEAKAGRDEGHSAAERPAEALDSHLVF